MKQFHITFVAVSLIFAASGCASTGISRTQASAQRIDTISTGALRQKDQVAKAIDALNLLPGSSGDVLKKRFSVFSSELKRTEDGFRKFVLAHENLKTRNDNYLTRWESELGSLTDEDLKTRSQERLLTVRENLTSLTDKGVTTIGALGDHLGYLKQIHKYLSLDLTPKGVTSIQDLIKRSNDEAATVYSLIEEYRGLLDESYEKLSLKEPSLTP